MNEYFSLAEYEFNNECVVIDPYNSDLNLIIDKELLLAYPIASEGFCQMWAGCKATHGVNSDRAVFEVHLEDNCECVELPKDDPEPYLIRVGWSLGDASLQLGEEPYSFAFCSNGKKCCNKVFEDYGEQFQKGDSVAAYLDFDSDVEHVLVSFSKNGVDMGVAFRLAKKELDQFYAAGETTTDAASKMDLGSDDAVHSSSTTSMASSTTDAAMAATEPSTVRRLLFFPHVLTKNVVFEMNFGQRVSLIGDEPFAPIKSDFLLIQKYSLDKRFPFEHQYMHLAAGAKRESNVIMLVGLPGSGKTSWAKEFVRRNPKKLYNIIGMSTILEKMKMLGLKKKPLTSTNANTSGQQQSSSSSSSATASSAHSNITATLSALASTGAAESGTYSAAKITNYDFLDKLLKCVNALCEIAAQSNRNVILDQPNLYESTRRRQMRHFAHYDKRRAVVIMPDADAFKRRIADMEPKDNKDMFADLINDFKANMTLPRVDGTFDSVEYALLSETEAVKLAEEYRIEGADDRLQKIINRRRKVDKSLLGGDQAAPQLLPGAGLKNTAAFRSNYGMGSSSSSSLSSSISSSSSFGFKRDPNYKYNRFNNPGQSKRMFNVSQHQRLNTRFQNPMGFAHHPYQHPAGTAALYTNPVTMLQPGLPLAAAVQQSLLSQMQTGQQSSYMLQQAQQAQGAQWPLATAGAGWPNQPGQYQTALQQQQQQQQQSQQQQAINNWPPAMPMMGSYQAAPQLVFNQYQTAAASSSAYSTNLTSFTNNPNPGSN